MSTERKNDGGPAFPVSGRGGHIGQTSEDQTGRGFGGMTLRDWFAGHALCGAIAQGPTKDESYGSLARVSYKLADAMLAEREKGTGS